MRLMRCALVVLVFPASLLADTHRWLGQADAVAQVSVASIDSVDATPADNTFTVTIGGVSISQVGDTDVATTAAALVALLNASTHPYFAAVTWTNPSAGNIVGTADVAGVPFVAALTKTGAGSGAVTDFSDTTASAGPNDWSTAANWTGGAVPANGDTVIIENNATPILWGLDQSAVTLAELRIMQSYTGLIGLDETKFVTSVSGITETASTRPEYRDTYLKVGATLLNIGQFSGGGSTPAGAARVKVDVGTAQTAIIVENTSSASADTGLQPVRLLGSHANNTLEIRAGIVGIGTTNSSETANVLTTIGHGGQLTYGPGVTWNNAYINGGTARFFGIGSGSVLRCTNSRVFLDIGSGQISQITAAHGSVVSTMGAFTADSVSAMGGTVIYRSGNIAAAGASEGGTIDFSQTSRALTVTSAGIEKSGGTFITNPLVTFTNDLEIPTSNLASMRIVASPAN